MSISSALTKVMHSWLTIISSRPPVCRTWAWTYQPSANRCLLQLHLPGVGTVRFRLCGKSRSKYQGILSLQVLSVFLQVKMLLCSSVPVLSSGLLTLHIKAYQYICSILLCPSNLCNKPLYDSGWHQQLWLILPNCFKMFNWIYQIWWVLSHLLYCLSVKYF